ncbi:aminopeptidase N C-terminal domain-containing protein, partial [Xanthobacter autotrophicus]|uniref:aminopeptidase N C-terminal domain-containing protein n=1 Tax=Xanthobacter autotrophicus TaxID=280 RepID=UPI0024AB5F84
PSHSYTFVNVDAEPVPSLLRGFSAPVLLDIDATDAQLLTLLAHDTDPFNRWEAGQRLALRIAIEAVNDASVTVADGGTPDHELLPASFVAAMHDVLRHPALVAAFKELVLSLPSEGYIAEQLDVVDPQRVHAVREAMRLQLA